ncbi:MAG TPA: ORF6N domain-containing protein [Candidatus Methylomirabilis sp.]|jgi:hypothetical protein|nr:ORF6N domain-containing protein [Candidatus Methylomirabilis sp.]
MSPPVLTERIEERILLVRGHKVVLDAELAQVYGVPTKVLNQAVSRNIERFPRDFMFVLTPQELAEWRSQFVTSKADRKGLRYAPMAFTGQGGHALERPEQPAGPNPRLENGRG